MAICVEVGNIYLGILAKPKAPKARLHCMVWFPIAIIRDSIQAKPREKNPAFNGKAQPTPQDALPLPIPSSPLANLRCDSHPNLAILPIPNLLAPLASQISPLSRARATPNRSSPATAHSHHPPFAGRAPSLALARVARTARCPQAAASTPPDRRCCWRPPHLRPRFPAQQQAKVRKTPGPKFRPVQ